MPADCANISVFELQPATAVVAAVSGRFRADTCDLAVATSSRVSLYAPEEGELQLVADCELETRLTSLLVVKRPPKSKSSIGDVLLCSTLEPSGRPILLALYWDSEIQNLKFDDFVHLSFNEDYPLPGRDVSTRPDAAILATCVLHLPGDEDVTQLVAVSVANHVLQLVTFAWHEIDGIIIGLLKRLTLPVEYTAPSHASGARASLCLPAALSMVAVSRLRGRPPAEGYHIAILYAADDWSRSLCCYFSVRSHASLPPTGRVDREDCRRWDLHETTNVLAPWPAADLGVVLISQVSVRWDCDGSARETKLGLGAPPTCCAVLEEGKALAIGDGSGGITLLLAAEGETITARTVQSEMPACLPTSLAVLPAGADGEVLLFVGSWASSSQLLQIQVGGRQQGQAQTLAGLPGCGCLAPVSDAVAVHDGSGSGEGALLLACGIPPAGSVCLAEFAAALIPAVVDGTTLQHRPQLLPIRGPSGSGGDAYLALSFDAAGYTTLLDVRGTSVRPVQPPGLVLERPSLLLARLPDDRLLQITPEEVRVVGDPERGVLRPPELTWRPEMRVAKAAISGSVAAVAAGSTVWLLDLGQPSAITASEPRSFPQQVSALALLQLGSPQIAEELWLAVGQWHSNEVHLSRLASQQGATVVAVAQGQPRSFAVGTFSIGQVLFVGTSDGTVVFRSIKVDGEGGVAVGPQRWVRVGLAGVDLEWLPARHGNPDCMFATSDRILFVRELPEDAFDPDSSDVVGTLEAVRVHGGEACSPSCGLDAPEMPGGRAWISSRGHLTFGTVDYDLNLRCTRQVIGDTPLCVLHHQSSGCALVLAEDSQGQSWLHLLQASSLRQISRVQVMGQRGTALCWARLPTARVGGRSAEQYAVLACVKQWVDEDGSARECGALHVIEVATDPAGSSGPELIIHGGREVPSPCFSLASVDSSEAEAACPELPGRPLEMQEHDALKHQLVLVGCRSGVQLYRVSVQPVVEQGMAFILEAAARVARGAADSGASDSSRDRRWRDCVDVQLLAQAEPVDNGCAFKAAALNQSVAVAELMGTVTVFKAQTQAKQLQQGRGLLRASALLDSPGPVSAIAFLDEWHCIGGLFPKGLVLLRRDDEAEAEAEAIFLQQLRADAEASASGRAVRGATQPQVMRMAVCANPELSQTVTSLSAGHLGIIPYKSGQDAEGGNRQWRPWLYATKEGGVGLIQPWSQAEHEMLETALEWADLTDNGGDSFAAMKQHIMQEPAEGFEEVLDRAKAMTCRQRAILRTVQGCLRGS